ncbi:MAG: hypothetical protein Q9211_000062 [Gyalolechia sp. 1 TL-2023]
MEKDLINHEFRTLVEEYATVMTLDLQTISWWSLAFFPSVHLATFLNRPFRSRWAPQSQQPYSLQLRATLRFRTKDFINEVMASLARVDLVRSYNLTGQTEAFRVALAANRDHQDQLQARIEQSTFTDRWIRRATDIKARDEALVLAKENYKLILDLRQIAGKYPSSSRRLTEKLMLFRQRLMEGELDKVSPAMFSTVLKPLLVQLDRGNRTTNPDALRTSLGRLCKDGRNGKQIPRELHILCAMDDLRVTLSQLDDDTFIGIQRSWFNIRDEAIERYELKTRTDIDGIFDVHFDYPLDL